MVQSSLNYISLKRLWIWNWYLVSWVNICRIIINDKIKRSFFFITKSIISRKIMISFVSFFKQKYTKNRLCKKSLRPIKCNFWYNRNSKWRWSFFYNRLESNWIYKIILKKKKNGFIKNLSFDISLRKRFIIKNAFI